MAPLLLLTALVSATPAEAKPDAFASWFDSRVKAESARVLSHEQVDLDGDGRKDHLACFVLPRADGTSAPVGLVGLSTGSGSPSPAGARRRAFSTGVPCAPLPGRRQVSRGPLWR
jgi:hypothetical protein